jgi:hypothetical protein
MEVITWISFILAIIGVLLSSIALYIQWRDKPILKISSIRPGISGYREGNEQQWKHQVTSIEVIIENKGSRPAIDCEGIVTFPLLEALPLYCQTREHYVNLKSRLFTLQPNTKATLVGAWNFCSNGSIDGTKESLSPGDFLIKCTPATVIVKYGNKRIQTVLQTEEAKRIFEQHQTQVYLGS